MLGHPFIFGARKAVVGKGIDADAATGSEDASHLYIFGLHETDEIFHDDVDTVLMEVAVVAETEEVELEALALYHQFARDVHDANLCKVGLSGDGAEGGELRAIELYPVVVVWMLVNKCLQYLWSVVITVCGLCTKGAKAFFFSC